MKKFILTSVLISSLGLSGCIYFGSHNMPPDRIRYNKSVISSDLQQALLNLVRLKYGDMPYFLSLNNIVSQYSVNASISADGSRTYSDGESVTNFLSLTPSASVSESPTLTYTPLQGEEFVQRLMTPIDIKVVSLALREGWTFARVFRTFFQRLGDMENAAFASRPNSHRIPEYKDFARFTKIMRKLELKDELEFEFDNSTSPSRIKFDILSFKPLTADEIKFLYKHTGASPSNPNFWVAGYYEQNHMPRTMVGETRTMFGIYSYLSKGVELPQAHYSVGNALKLPNGEYFDWKQVVGGLIRVKFCQSIPERAYIYVYYRGYYFYIDDTDRSSKEGMSLLLILNGIFQGNIQSVLPVFTIN